MVGVTSLSDFLTALVISRCLFSPALTATTSVTGALWRSFDSLSLADVSSAYSTPVRGQCALGCQRHGKCQGFFYNDVNKMCVQVTSESDFVQSSPSFSGFRYYTNKYTCPMTTTTKLIYVDSFSCFVVNDKPWLWWEEARDLCNSTGGQLAVLDTRGKVDFMMDVMLNTTAYSYTYHLGARRPMDKWNTAWPASGQDFVWLNGQPLDVTVADGYWSGGGPNNYAKKQNIILIEHAQIWNDFKDKKCGHVCQYSLV